MSKGLARPHTFLVALTIVGATSCSSTPAPSKPKPQAPPSLANESRPEEAPSDPIASASASSFEAFRSARFNLSIPLPDASRFRLDDQSERWLVATHAPTDTVLRLRTWREDDVGARARCEARARSWRAIPEREGSRLLEARKLDVPRDHDTLAEARIRPKSKTNPAEGFVLAFGGWAHRCFAYVLITHASDEKLIASRLATMVSGSLARIREESELVAPRIQPEKPRFDDLQPR